MVLLWLALKHFKTTWLRVKIIILTIAIATADFTILFALTQGWNAILTAVLIFVLTSIALSATLLHLAKYASYDIGVFKALGARRGTITASLMLELVLVGVVGTSIGVFAGMGFLAGLATVIPTETVSAILPLGFLSLLVVSCLLAILAGAFAGVCFAWKKSGETVVEILTNAK